MNEERLENHVLNMIYEELKQANVNRNYAGDLIDKQVMSTTWFNVVIASLSAGGAILSIVGSLIPIITSGLAAIGLLANQFYPVFFLKTDDLTKLIRLQTDYNIYFNKVQNLFNIADARGMSATDAQNALSKLIEDNASKATEISKIFGKINKKMEKNAIAKSEEYLNSVYHDSED